MAKCGQLQHAAASREGCTMSINTVLGVNCQCTHGSRWTVNVPAAYATLHGQNCRLTMRCSTRER